MEYIVTMDETEVLWTTVGFTLIVIIGLSLLAIKRIFSKK